MSSIEDVLSSNKRFGTTKSKLTPYGRKIDLIVAGRKIQLATNEWKKSDVSDTAVAKQQSKNVRMNKAILTSLEKYEVPQGDQKYVYNLAMDWRGK